MSFIAYNNIHQYYVLSFILIPIYLLIHWTKNIPLLSVFMHKSLDDYIETINLQNINGAVLSHCNIMELKNVLGMSFGDWEMFQLVLLALRDHEKTQKNRSIAIVRSIQNEEVPPATKSISTIVAR